jgi:hypothetical protein
MGPSYRGLVQRALDGRYGALVNYMISKGFRGHCGGLTGTGFAYGYKVTQLKVSIRGSILNACTVPDCGTYSTGHLKHYTYM